MATSFEQASPRRPRIEIPFYTAPPLAGGAETAIAEPTRSIVEDALRVPRLASTDGFLRRGNTTLMMGVAGGKAEHALGILRTELSPQATPRKHRTTAFVLNVAQYDQP